MTEFCYYAERNLLIYPYSAGAPLHALPEAKVINGSYFAVPRTLHNAQILRHYNYPVVPIMDGYDFPHAPGITPYESQISAANFMVLHPRCFNLSDMGTGKTLAALWAADWLMRNKIVRRALIVCPLSIMQRVWGDAIFKHFLHRRSFQILHGSAEQRSAALAKEADIYIINTDGLAVGARVRGRLELDGFSKQLAERDDIGLAIVDEASAYKDAQTKRHRVVRLIIGRMPYLWLLTGTPTPNAPTDAFGLAKLVNNAFGKGFVNFRMETMQKIGLFRWVPQRDGYEKARRLLSPSIRIDIRDVWDGPEMTTQQRQVELTADQKQHMADLKRHLQIALKSGQLINAANEAAMRTKFLQVSQGAIYDADHASHGIDAAPRHKELLAVIEEAPSKILCLVPFTNVIRVLYKVLREKWSCEIVNGEVTQKQRSRIFSDFQSSTDPRILLADPGTMAHGLDLWAAQTVIWYGPVDKSELYAQANRRAHRPGQKHPVTVVQIVSNQLEREIFRRLENHLSLQGALLDAVRKGEL